MKNLRRIYLILSSVTLAVTLILLVAVFVIAGTFVESWTGSHRQAEMLTYHNPLFKLLLWGIFVNIFLATTRRWPFRIRHIPFLITHLGLLMILAGVLMKGYFGTQGTMAILEGNGSETIFINNTYALHVEKRDSENPQKIISYEYPVGGNILGRFITNMTDENSPFPDLEIELMEYRPHSLENFETWVKGDKGILVGAPPIPVKEWEEGPFPEPTSVAWQFPFEEKWNMWTLRTDAIVTALRQAFLRDAVLLVKNSDDEVIMLALPLKDALEEGITIENPALNLELDIVWETLEGFKKVELKVTHNGEIYRVPLFGDKNLFEVQGSKKLPFNLDIKVKPTLLVIEDSIGDNYLFGMSSYGQFYGEHFPKGGPESLVVYDKGFGGYSVQTELPFIQEPNSREDRFLAKVYLLTIEVRRALRENMSISSQMRPLYRVSEGEGEDFIEVWLRLLYTWLRNDKGALSPDLARILSKLSGEERKLLLDVYLPHMGSQLSEAIGSLDDEIDIILRPYIVMKQFKVSIDKILAGKDLKTNRRKADYLLNLNENNLDFLAAKKALQEMFHIMEVSETEITPEILAGIFLDSVPIFVGDTSDEAMKKVSDALYPSYSVLEAPLTKKYRDLKMKEKLEENTPRVSVLMRNGKKEELVTLGFDTYANGLKWSALGGEYRVRFQPRFMDIPYRVRLRDGRQINYPDSGQAYSYESDIIITNKESGEKKDATISMNNVHETWDGYRFYMASIDPPQEVAAQRVQIIVNHDPAKYWLTYSGAIVLSIGIIGLFWGRKRKSFA